MSSAFANWAYAIEGSNQHTSISTTLTTHVCTTHTPNKLLEGDTVARQLSRILLLKSPGKEAPLPAGAT